VVTSILQNPRATLREIARNTDLTERAVYQIVRDLEQGGFIAKKKVGRRNDYAINKEVLLSQPVYGNLSLEQLTSTLRRLMD
jgi:predicted transcriptional regulator